MTTSKISLRGLAPEQRRAVYLLLQKRKVDVLAHMPIERVERDVPQPLSGAQRRLYVFAQLNPESSAYHIAGALRLRGRFDHAAAERALAGVVARHEALRTTFIELRGVPHQVVHAELPIELESTCVEVADDELRELATAEIERPFDLERGPLLRARLLRLSEDHAVCVLTLHHIVADAWSLDLVLSEFCARYEAALRGRGLELPEPKIQYVDYACFQREWLEAGERERQLGYHRAQLADLREGALALPLDRPRPAVQSHRGATLRSALSPALSRAVKQLAQTQATTLFVVLLGTFKALLYRHTGERDLAVGVPVANRERRETHEVVGFFVNTQVLRSELAGRTTFAQLIDRLKQQTREAQRNRELPFDELVDELAPTRSLSHNPLFQVMYNHLKQSPSALASLPDLTVEGLSLPAATTQFDLTLDTQEDESGQLWLAFEYAVDLFDRETIERMQASFLRLLEAFTRDPNTCIGDVELVDEPARAPRSRGRRGGDYKPVHERIREQAALRGPALALRCGADELSFEALEQRVATLAARLVEQGAEREVVVGVTAERTLDSIVAMLAVWRAGAAFVPLDLSYPADRLRVMVKDAAVRFVIVRDEHVVPEQLAALPRVDPRAIATQSGAPSSIHAEQVAYVLFTSGSTGRAKPVAVSHGALALQVGALASVYELTIDERCLQFSSFSFDASLEQWLVPLAAGACVVIRPDELWSAEQCATMLTAQGITRVDLPPAYARELVTWASKHQHALQLRSCTVGGEALPRETLQRLRGSLPNAAIYNAYGPTEAVITPLLFRANGDVDSAYAPIGRPLAGRTCYVLDSELKRVPDGVVGELYLGGEALARGYAGRPAQTSERFLPDPFGEPGARLYRTGDRARVRSDGVVEYVGRDDRQVKLRGFRVELGEVEAQLLRLPSVREAFACVREQPTQLVAFVAADDAQATTLLDLLSQSLPAYMVPAQLLVLSALPRTDSGKVDARALLALREASAEEQGEAPRGELEQLLAQAFAEVLGQQTVMRDANFFQLGGDSIVSLQLVSRAREHGLVLTPRDVFQQQTVRALARVVKRATDRDKPMGPVDPVAHGALPLTPIQRDFFANVQTAQHHYNQSVLLRAKSLDTAALTSALHAVVELHAALRLRFTRGEAGATQHFVQAREACSQPLLWERRCRDSAELLAACEEAQRSLDLSHGPLLRALHAHMSDGSSRLLLVVHHLVVDGVSWRILLEDLAIAYAASSRNAAPSLLRSTSDYGSWTKQLASYATSAELALERAYWATRTNENPPLLAPKPGARLATAACTRKVQTQLDREHTALLLREAHAAYRTQGSELLLAALVHAVSEVTGASSISIEVEGHGRDERFADIDVSRTVGWFTTLYPLALRASPELGQTIINVKEEVRAARLHALSYGVLKELARDLPEGCVRPHITFNYLGQFDGALAGEDALFQLAEESRGSDQDEDQTLGNALEINGQIFDGVLTFTLSYGAGSYDETMIEQLARAFERALVEVAEHGRAGALRALTPSDFPLASLTPDELAALPFAPSEIEDVYPLTPMQQGLLFHSLEVAEASTYVNQLDVEVGGLDPARLAAAWQRLLLRHPLMRTAIVWQGGLSRPVQVVTKNAPAEVEQLDLSASADQAAALAELRGREHARGFLLEQAPLLRLVIARLDEDRHQLLFTSHHLLLDGWSNSRLIGDLLRAYAGDLDAAEPPLFRDYLAWLEARPKALAEQFWREKLAQIDEPSYLAGSIASSSAARERASGHGRVYHTLTERDTAMLSTFAKEQRVTLNTLVQAAWALILSAYSGKPCVTFGTTVAGRPSSLPGSEQMLGLFINTLPSVQRVGGVVARVGDFLRALQDSAVAAREHEHTPLYTLQRWAGQAGRPLFDTLLVFENYPADAALARAGAGLRFGKTHGIESTNYPLAISVVAERTVAFGFEYDRASFDEPAVERLSARFVHALMTLARDADARLCSLAIVTTRDAEKLALLTPQPAPYLHDGFVHERIAQLARLDPDARAVTSAGESLTFGELDAQANRLAHRLIALGVHPEQRVGIALERSPRLIVALLAVLKAGGCYVPLDPNYPSERLAFMQEDGELTLLITSSALAPSFGPHTPILHIEDATLGAEPSTPPRVALLPEHAAYMIYTSGSTGRPKGVVVAHAALSMHCHAARALYALSKQDCALHLASISFDAAVEQWLVPLLSGARLLFDPDLRPTPEQLLELVQRERVSLVYPPTSHLHGMAQLLADQGRAHHIRLCTVGGEAVSRDTIARLRETFTPERIINGYGPTEAVITPLLLQLAHDTVCNTAYAPIGTVVGERTAFVLDPDLRPQPPGVIGELYIGGAGLARGYHRRPGLTAERFLPDPNTPGGRMYRTGDLVRMLDSGDFEYIGRVDQQIKLRGFRIEPGEIEAVLLTLEGVHEAAVLVEAQPVKRLLAYVAGARDEQSVLEALRARLPEHMVPARVVVLERLPRTPNGKVDRKLLPAPELRERAFAAPTNESERQLARLFSDVLGVDQIGRDDNFFELGGDSIVSIQLVSRARKQGLALTPRQVFQHPTPRALADVVRAHHAAPEPSGPVEGEVSLTPIQAEFFALALPTRQHFNQSLLLRPRHALDRGALRRALAVVARHHDALRLRYREEHGRVVQHYLPSGDYVVDDQLSCREIARTEVEAHCQAAQRSLDLQRGPLMRALHLRLDDGSERLLLVVHHLVVDGVSFRILLEDLDQAYRAAQQGETAELQRTSSFQAWSSSLLRYSREAERDLPYWEHALRNARADLPRDHDDEREHDTRRETVRLVFDRAFTERLLRDSGRAYRTRIDELLLAALARVMCRYAGTSSVLIELEGHGREELGRDELGSEVDTSRTLGWFTSSFPVQLSPHSDERASIIAVKEQLRAVPARGLSFGVLKYLARSALRERMHAFPRPDISFNYLGQFDQSFDDERALFVPASEASGDEHAPDVPLLHSFAIGGEIYGGELRLTFGYAPARHERATVERLADGFRDQLTLLVEHCARQAHNVLTPADVPFAALDFHELSRALAGQSRVRDVYRLTPMQEGMLFHALAASEAGQDVYVTQLVAEVAGLDVERFRAAWQATLDAHDTLRTSFVYRDLPHAVQRVHDALRLPFRVLHERELASSVSDLAAAERQRGFALDTPPLLRIVLIESADGSHQLIWTSHHLLLDGWSSSLMFGEVLQRYHGAHVEAPRARFVDYVGWLASQDAASSERYFRERLARLTQPTLLARTTPSATSGYGSTALRLTPEHTRALVALAHAEQVTLHTVVQGALIVLLQRLTGQRTVAFGSTVSGRPSALPEVEQLLGLFINTLPVVSGPSGSEELGAWLRTLQAEALELREHEHTPLYEIQRWAGLGGTLFDCLLVFENFPVARALGEQCGQLSFRTAVSHETTNYPLTIGVSHGDTLDLTFDFQCERFELAAVERVRDALAALLNAFAGGPSRKLGELSLVSEANVTEVRVAAAPRADVPEARGASPSGVGEPTTALAAQRPAQVALVHQQIARQAERNPDKLALVGAHSELSYASLDHRAAAVAQAICARTTSRSRELLVGVALERSPEALAVLLGVLRAGAAFVVLDPSYPDPYLRAIIERATLPMVIGHRGDAARFVQQSSLAFLAVEELAVLPLSDPQPSADDANALAYLLYTSGSTGAPKGVEVTAGALARQCHASAHELALDEHDQQLLFSSLAFDASLEQWLAPLMRGATVHVMAETWSPARMMTEIVQRGLTRLDLPPAYALTLARELEQTNRTLSGSLRSCTVGGEAIGARDLARVRERLQPKQLINAYGPTEAVITPTAWRCSADEALPEAGYAPIGTPLAGRVAYVLDAWLSPLPDGAVGELYLGGEPLARGYRAEPARTSERFVPDPFRGGGARMLRTGDRVQKRRDGVLEFVGRGDEQLKIRGFRVELGEVQTALASHPRVHEAAVIAQRDGSAAQLLAYAVAPDLDVAALLAYLRAILPAQAVPTHLSLLGALPRTQSGKLDVRALPTPERPARVHVAPRSAREQQLATAFADVLELAEVGIHDNFFELGGHSLRALSLVSQIERATGERMRLADILAYPTVEGLARVLEHTNHDARSPLVRLNAATGEAPLFCMHPAGGTAFAYTEVARKLAVDRPVYGLVCRSLLDAQFQDRSIAQMAEDYARAILSVQSTGPFSLLGWSLGGAIALSVAAALEARGHRVSFLGFVDGFVPGFDDPDEAAPELPVPEADGELLSQFQEREQGAQTLAHLTELSHTFTLPALHVAPHCWWSNEGRALRKEVLARLVAGTGQRPRASLELDTSHEQIVHHPAFLTSLKQELAASAGHAEEALHVG